MSRRRALTFCLLLLLPAAAGIESSPFRPRADAEAASTFARAGTPLPARHSIAGSVRDKISAFPFARFTVRVFDKDLAGGPPLGAGVTDARGRFQIDLSLPEVFQKIGRPPHVFFHVFNRDGRLVKATEHFVVVNAGADTRVNVELFHFEAYPDLPFGCFTQRLRSPLLTPALPVVIRSRTLADVIEQLKLRGEKFERLRQLLLQDAFLRREPWDDCGEGRISIIMGLLLGLGERRLAKRLELCIRDGAPVKEFFTDRTVIYYTVDRASDLDAVYPATPRFDRKLRLPDGTSLGYLRADLASLHPDNREVAPTYVQQIGLIAEHALSRFANPPLSLRDPRGDSPGLNPRVRIVVCGTIGLGATDPEWDHVQIAPKNSLTQNFGTVPHELFHRVQYRYNPTRTRAGLYGVMREGGARLFEDSYCDIFNRYVLQSQQIFQDPAQSLTDFNDECSNPVGYAGALFWKYLAEQHSMRVTPAHEPDIGFDVYRIFLERLAPSPAGGGTGYEVATLRAAFAKLPRPGSFDQFRYFDAAGTELDTQETAWGNYLVANYLHGDPTDDARFKYIEARDLVTWPSADTGLQPVERLARLRARVAEEDEITLGRGSAFSRTVVGHKPYSARYYKIVPDTSAAPGMLKVSVTTSSGMSDPLIQILRLGPGSKLVDINRSDRPAYTKTVNMRGLSSVVVIVASRTGGGEYTINFEEVPGGADVMVTRWNSAVLTEYELDPRLRAWSRRSPDVMVDNNDDLVPDDSAVPGVNNKLKVRLHNRGNAPASDVKVELWDQHDTPRLGPRLWLRVRDASHSVQEVTGESVVAGSPGGDKWVAVSWAPADGGARYQGWCVKVKVSTAGDLNGDNNIALSCVRKARPTVRESQTRAAALPAAARAR